ncbi:hypothetical protein DJ82_03800 [Halorubrum sp. Ib24]|uniref:hypothetical protein n=1 Tax=unclassified Halorubrum TaxID=2642239 RepID=UPI000B9832DB|nr:MULTISPECIES: hypothetical protein [unclassified Halorubrum]OYR40491.1 hypothetical protein DJ75_15215 [Halorubrum sp. Eb13]OYR42005.1 hypothetical protein DJ82_03800 [Halorubrum sp. Ib24]OYR46852.1 hypothetical protein DJ81_01995 [Halorubrum sp. Hd13]OYR54730.1 hypothetical protein DJ73_04330 [Halorubrum sp. Ea1]
MNSGDETPSDESAFRDELRSLLRRAHERDVDVEGGWECRNGAENPDWDIIVSEVRKPDESE